MALEFDDKSLVEIDADDGSRYAEEGEKRRPKILARGLRDGQE